MMRPTINLANYVKRIGYKGAKSSTLETLCDLHRLHTQAIPFENLNPLLGLPVKIDPASLQQKLIDNRRGGYCFEQNGLFFHVLKAIGFDVESFAGRVIWKKPETQITSLTHMILLVTIDSKKYHVDVGFGGQTPTGPLLFEPDIKQETPHEPYRILKRDAGYYVLQSKIGNEWKHLYRYTLQERYPIDFKMGNWYTATHPDSHFTNDLVAARAGEGCRYIVHNNELVTHFLDRKTDKKPLNSVEEIRNALEKIIGLRLPEADNLESVLNGFIEPTAES